MPSDFLTNQPILAAETQIPVKDTVSKVKVDSVPKNAWVCPLASTCTYTQMYPHIHDHTRKQTEQMMETADDGNTFYDRSHRKLDREKRNPGIYIPSHVTKSECMEY